MIAIEEQHASPDVDRLLVLGGEIVIEAEQQKLLYLRVTTRSRRGFVRVCAIVAMSVGHEAARL
jgi:hypothetical protein